ncbi:hypothetical protein NONI108955_11080 [Nocardia ninae]|uniref:Uncharacterized protein n=1 Tax=Nocardia ninae NBRC 108245 TaxID=1210091 RepID=A0A511MP41_9NOCA|nr:hypothetical protein [Nocardia ninae]GEM41958.1 hypothetical protein NN4_64770 [Nocardia ninae NBRC 108245]
MKTERYWLAQELTDEVNRHYAWCIGVAGGFQVRVAAQKQTATAKARTAGKIEGLRLAAAHALTVAQGLSEEEAEVIVRNDFKRYLAAAAIDAEKSETL